MSEFHPQDWITIVEALSVYDQWLGDEHDRVAEIFELQLAIAREYGFESPSAFVRQGCDPVRGPDGV